MMKYITLLFFSLCSIAQQTTNVDFIKCKAAVIPNFEEKSIKGKVYYECKVLKGIDSIRIDAKNMDFSEVLVNEKPVNFKNNKKELILYEGFTKGDNTISFRYKAFPKQSLYFIGTSQSHQIWTQGQGKYTSNWLPSFDDVNEKVIFNISVTYNDDYQVVSNGILLQKKRNLQEKTTFYEFEMEKPMSSYLVMLAIGTFNYQTEISSAGVILERYFKPQDSLKVEPTYRYSTKIFNFLEKEIGVKYPWKIYRQIPVNDFVYAGMENTTSTIFAQEYVVDELGFNDRNYINVNAHELAHQWFGDLITAKSGKHHWLQEGFATYYALLAEKEVFGEDYFYNKLYENWLQIKLQSQQKGVLPILNEKASSLSFYEKGAWALHTIRTDIGEKKFKKAVKNYLKKYSFKNVETDDFLAEIKKVSNFDTEKFKKKWLESTYCDS
ncbi:MAG: M1 family metallopeptidase, partial [Flavobacterium sp.]